MERFLEWDGQLLLWIKDTFAHPVLDKMMIFISSLGNEGMCWIVLALVFFLLGYRKKVWRDRGVVLASAMLADVLLCNVILKPLVNRTRPYVLLGYDTIVSPPGDASFPSGHTAISFAAAAALYAINKKWGIAAYIFSVIMGFSRLYLGMHFPLDVLAGAVVGTVSAKIALYLLKKRKKKDFSK
jgi:undecaprenyl-diphosphatase